jgi:hypothetical protein
MAIGALLPTVLDLLQEVDQTFADGDVVQKRGLRSCPMVLTAIALFV